MNASALITICRMNKTLLRTLLIVLRLTTDLASAKIFFVANNQTFLFFKNVG
jgi:hypothetical protein